MLYCLTNFFQNFGPNTTTFVVPGEVFPTRYRSTAHGRKSSPLRASCRLKANLDAFLATVSAASGKFGAIIAQIMAFQLKDRGGKNAFVPHILQIFALFMCVRASALEQDRG